nr:hypothetical protein Iba_chr13fCG7720 [Ipomoea batatas]
MGRIHPRRAHHHSSGHIHQQIVHIEQLFFVNILCVNRRIIAPLLAATAAIPAATLRLHHRRRASGGASYIRRVGGNGDGVPRGKGREVEHGLGAPKRQRRHVVGGRRHLRRRLGCFPRPPVGEEAAAACPCSASLGVSNVVVVVASITLSSTTAAAVTVVAVAVAAIACSWRFG